MADRGQGSGGWVDVTYPISPAMPVWPGQPAIECQPISKIDKPDQAQVSVLKMSVHCGTHIDAPNHFVAGDSDITAAPLSVMSGAVRVCEIDSDGHLTADDLLAFEKRTEPVTAGERLFFRSRNSRRDWTKEPFDKTYAAVDPSLAEALVQRGVDVVGVDYLSVAPFDDPATTHRILLHARVWIIEGLDLREISEGRYEFIAAPLKIVGSDASPLRVLLRPI